jgi:Animal haem peroxidase
MGQVNHGSESFFILGEGIVSVAAGGRSGAAGDDVTEGTQRTVEAVSVPPFRFSRLGPKGTPRLSVQNLTKVANAMTKGGGGQTGVPAGFTYLGQFIDHDLTFDATTVSLGEDVSPAAMLQGRSPALDLDSLYGAGPTDPESAKFYTDDRHLKMGRTVAVGADAARDGHDLPRAGTGPNKRAKRAALIPDRRNDENLVVAQTHLAMIRFHNRVVDTLPASVPAAQRFRRARAKTVRHYQWMIRHDYLPRIVETPVLDDVFANGRKVFEVGASPLDVPTMPVEFSVAAFRLGHSMVRASYNWNRRFDDGSGTLDLLFAFSGTSGDLLGGLALPSNWIADFRRLYDFGEAGRAALVVPPAKFNRAHRIDTRLVDPLKNLPPGSFGGPAVPFNDPRANLAFRNLVRARMMRLATGQQMVALLRSKGVAVRALTRRQILAGVNGADLSALTATERDNFVARTPLWFYILREAEINGGKLSGVGARLVAETFHRAIEGSRFSIVRNPAFRPSLGPNSTTFRMVDLLLFAFEGKKTLLNPLGG